MADILDATVLPVAGEPLIGESYVGILVGVAVPLRVGRIRVNFFRGFIDDALTAGELTISSPDLARLPALGVDEYIPLTIDPRGDPTNPATAPEIVWITAHTAGATVGTIARGQEDTVARAHDAGTLIVCAPTTLDALE